MQVGLGPGHIVLGGDPAPPKGHNPPIFGPYLFQPNGFTRHEARPLPGDFLLDGDPAPPPQKGAEPPPKKKIGQTAGWIKMALGMEIGSAQATLC